MAERYEGGYGYGSTDDDDRTDQSASFISEEFAERNDIGSRVMLMLKETGYKIGLPDMEAKHNTSKTLTESMDPVEGRKITDVIWLLLLILVGLASLAIGIQSIHAGDPKKLLSGIDYQGRVCGYSHAVADKPYLYFIRFDGTAACVDHCPSRTNTTHIFACVDRDDIPDYIYTSSTKALVNNGYGYCNWQYATTDVYGYCMFTDETISEEYNSDSDRTWFSTVSQDVWETRLYILLWGLFSAVIISFLYLHALRNDTIALTVMWGCISLIFVLFVGAGIVLFILVSKGDD